MLVIIINEYIKIVALHITQEKAFGLFKGPAAVGKGARCW